jgi:hypothetical protein
MAQRGKHKSTLTCGKRGLADDEDPLIVKWVEHSVQRDIT